VATKSRLRFQTLLLPRSHLPSFIMVINARARERESFLFFKVRASLFFLTFRGTTRDTKNKSERQLSSYITTRITINKNVYYHCSKDDDFGECRYYHVSNNRTKKKSVFSSDRSRGTGETEIEESGEFVFCCRNENFWMCTILKLTRAIFSLSLSLSIKTGGFYGWWWRCERLLRRRGD